MKTMFSDQLLSKQNNNFHEANYKRHTTHRYQNKIMHNNMHTCYLCIIFIRDYTYIM